MIALCLRDVKAGSGPDRTAHLDVKMLSSYYHAESSYE
jgi:hypothetical protein